jgi:acetylornithine deacetylase
MLPVVKLLRELIALPSVNPAFLSEGDPRAGERRVAEFIAATAARAGLDVELQEVLPGRFNVFARLSPSGRCRGRVLLAPHLDTVGGEGSGLFRPRIVHGRLHGRGACDTKGSVAVMLTALFDLALRGGRPASTELVFAGLIDEENVQAGSRHLACGRLRADLAIVGEPTRAQVVTAHKGDLWLQIETRGKAAHGAHPELGRNAVHEMARIVNRLETTYARQLRRRRHPLLGHATVNVGSIRGGTQPNIVPDRCTISVDRRTLPGETQSSVEEEIRVHLRRAGFGAHLVDLRGAPCDALETPADLPLVHTLLKAARQKSPRGVHYFCDAAVLAGGGISSVVFGPGDIAQAHTPDEWIQVRQLEVATAILQRFLGALP